MKIAGKSYFKDENLRQNFYSEWVNKLSVSTQTKYEKIEIDSLLGKTVIWGINHERTDLQPVVIFPGFRTSPLFWDLDNNLKPLKSRFRIFLVETNGQPNLSDTFTPSIKNNDYGLWAADVISKLGLETTTVMGASFGGLVISKLCLVASDKVEKAFFLNPGNLQFFNLTLKNLYYNLLPIISPSKTNVEKFLNNAVLFPPYHSISKEAMEMLVDFQYFALTQMVDKAEKPYSMSDEDLNKINNEIYLIEGEKDVLFNYQKQIQRAKKHFKNLKEVKVFENVGHGIETYPNAIEYIANNI
jgi:pimeloyl-ACP methyl ester carboxylesterase